MNSIELEQKSTAWLKVRILKKTDIKAADGHFLYECECPFCGSIVLKKISNALRAKKCGRACPALKTIGSYDSYNVWKCINQRCYNPNNQDYYNYGERGITMCEEWKNNSLSFVKWAEENGYQKGLHIDRINNNLGYSPDNCRFVTAEENARNKNKRCVYKRKDSGMYQVKLGKKAYGTYKTEEEANLVYDNIRLQEWGTRVY